ncbi:MAG: cytochrome C oxidase subunit IV family protein [Crocinitomicaceae bacterium]|jgi:cytochrome c oxidase subunit IV|nr:cytochrome C oxidase subunit IV family protein [Crocinitomicaceae bacterium]MDP4723406.1 cytochrome C oxidase subunit IV family protein [Crocinitomicaceae bacterium]MDP4739387.1 cytochrome C oxidase subunit IV family protein [Crocinitomicaceae bacterium]MDP4805906.1 cytochrome C oxidase subunit IV family protein [Crocinitomicaceae bacterium]MDP4867861.1 cytochrome C oxidase subunit IV family protein [Crocinitomicaceae bacterium]
MERDDLIEYSLHAHHDDAKGKEIRKKIYKVTILLTAITIFEVIIGAGIKQSSDYWSTVKVLFILLTLLKAGYIVMVFMHLGDERPYLRNVILIPYFIFVAYLIFIALVEGTAIGSVWATMWQ